MSTWTEIDRQTAPSAGVFDFASLTLTGYEVIQIVVSGVTVTTDGTDVKLTFYVSGSEIVTGYRWGQQAVASTTGSVDDGDASDPAILLNSDNATQDTGNAAGESFSCLITVDAPLSSALYKKAEYETVNSRPDSDHETQMGVGIMENAGAITGLKISGSSSLTAGNVRILGLA